MRGMRTMERSRGKTSVSDSKVTCIAVTYQGLSPFDALDYRIREAMDAATVRRMGDGTFRASTPCLDPFYSGGYSVTVPEIPGCNTCGDTMDEVRHNVVEAAELMLESNSTLT